mgnify:CR=1 FL=1
MDNLKLNFLDQDQQINWENNLDPIEKILHQYGQKIYEYAKGYFNYVVTTASFAYDDEIREAALYIIIPEIGYDYRVLTISYEDANHVNVSFYTLQAKQQETESINIKEEDWEDKVKAKVEEYLSSSVANNTFKFLVDQVEEKRTHRQEI